MARINNKPKDNWPSRRELIAIVQQQDELIGQQNVELAELRADAAEQAAADQRTSDERWLAPLEQMGGYRHDG